MSNYSYVTPAHAIQGRNAHRPNALTEGAPDPSIDNEVRWLNKVFDRAMVAPQAVPSVSREATPGIQAETRGMNWVARQEDAAIPARSFGLGASEAVHDPETGSVIGMTPTLGGKIARAWADFTCWRGHSVIGGAVASIWLGPAGGQAVTSASMGIKGALCPRFGAEGDARKLANQLGIRQVDAVRLLKAGTYIWDEGEGKYVRTTTWRLFKIAARPYTPYIALGGLILAVVLATRE